MLVLPTQPRGGSVIFSFSNKSCTAWATTATASLMWADSFLPLMSCRPITPAAGTGEAGQHCRHHRLLRAQRLGTASTRLRAEDPLDAVGSSLSFRQEQAGAAGLGWLCPAGDSSEYRGHPELHPHGPSLPPGDSEAPGTRIRGAAARPRLCPHAGNGSGGQSAGPSVRDHHGTAFPQGSRGGEGPLAPAPPGSSEPGCGGTELGRCLPSGA